MPEGSLLLAAANYSPSSASDGDKSGSADDVTYVTWRVVFAVILACGLITNCALIIYILRGQRRIGSLEPPQLNAFVVAVHAAANVVNCLANGIWIVYTAASGRQSDTYTTTGCSFDAAVVQMIVIVYVVGLAVMSVDRFMSVRNAGFAAEQRGFSMPSTGVLITLAWLCAVGFSLPLVVPNGIDIEGNSQRFLCTMDSEASTAYVWATAVVGYVCPIGVVTAMFVGTAVSATMQRRKLASSRVFTSSTGSGTPGILPIQAVDGHRPNPAAALAVEVSAAKYVVCLFATWCLFVLPFPILSLVRIGCTAALPSKSRPFSYAKEVDILVTLLFVSYPILLPIITYIRRKNICCRCVHRVRTCCRESVIATEAGTSGQSLSLTSKRSQAVAGVHPFNSNSSASRQSGFETGGSAPDGRPVPVLFATPHGLRIRSSSAPNGLPDNATAADCQVKSSEDGKR